MKVLLALHAFPPERSGGVECAAEGLALALRDLGVDVVAFVGRPDRGGPGDAALETGEHRGIRVHRYRRLARRDDPADEYDPEASRLFEETLLAERPDLVHVLHWHRLSNDLVTVAVRVGVPAIVMLQDLWVSCSRFFRMPRPGVSCDRDESVEACGPCTAELRPMEAGQFAVSLALRRESLRQELRLARLVTYSSPSHRARLEALGPLAEPGIAANLRRLPIGLVDEIRPARPLRPRADGVALRVGHWGNLAAIKGLEGLARAAARATSPIELVLAGRESEPGLIARLEELAAPARVSWLGPYEREALPELTRDLDIVVFPSLAPETHGLVVDEALALGLPVLVSDAGALGERVGGRGEVLPAGDVAAWAAALDRVARDEVRASLLAAAPGELVDRVSWARTTLDAYHEVVRRGAPPRIEAPELARCRVARRDDAMLDIEWFVDRLQERYALARRALAGDEAARAELERIDPASPDAGSGAMKQ
ncbi:MAG: glycosyltransferase [Planctomycetota bacterium]